MSRGDLTEVEWRILRVLLPVERKPEKRGRGRLPADNRKSTASYGGFAPVRRGAMYAVANTLPVPHKCERYSPRAPSKTCGSRWRNANLN